MQSPSTSSAPAQGISRVVILLVSGICALAGYGLGRWQGTVATAAVSEQLDSVKGDAQTSQKALVAVEARTKRLEARQRINIALEAFGRNDISLGMSHLQEADRALSYKPNEVSKPLGERLHALLKSDDVSHKIRDLKALGDALDKDLMITRASASGG